MAYPYLVQVSQHIDMEGAGEFSAHIVLVDIKQLGIFGMDKGFCVIELYVLGDLEHDIAGGTAFL